MHVWGIMLRRILKMFGQRSGGSAAGRELYSDTAGSAGCMLSCRTGDWLTDWLCDWSLAGECEPFPTLVVSDRFRKCQPVTNTRVHHQFRETAVPRSGTLLRCLLLLPCEPRNTGTPRFHPPPPAFILTLYIPTVPPAVTISNSAVCPHCVCVCVFVCIYIYIYIYIYGFRMNLRIKS
jgi:hypothetical protein